MAQFTGFTRNKASEILGRYIDENSYVCIFNIPPDENGNGFVEPDPKNGYVRQNFGYTTNAIKGQVANMETIFLFESINEGCGSAEYVGLATSSMVGSLSVFLVAKLVAPISIPAGTVPLIRKYAFKIGLDKEELEEYE